MSGLTASVRARIQARITKLEAAIDAAEDTLLELMSSAEESYKFDSREGSQQLKNKDVTQLQQTIDDMYTQLEHLYQRLGGIGIMRLNLRRKHRSRLQWVS